MTKIKICGLTRLCDIDAVNAANPEYVGFVFAESRRRVTPRQAERLRARLAKNIVPVGVFVNERVEKIVTLTRNGIIAMIQLHGAEDEEYLARLKSLTNAPVIKALAMEPYGNAAPHRETFADYLLLDSKGGGTGRAFDWRLIGATSKPYFLAGGLNAGNVAAALKETAPYALDVSSGVESMGVKDAKKINEFIRRVRNE
jgi:phosphoribosylanthranilate isomerase